MRWRRRSTPRCGAAARWRARGPGRARARHPVRRTAVGERRAATRSRACARGTGRGRADGRPPLRAALPLDGPFTRRRRDARGERRRPADPPPGRSPPGAVLGPRVAVVGVPERPRLRLHRVSAARRREADLQRGLPVRRRRRADPRAVVDAPWLRRMQPTGEDVSVVLETANGHDRIRPRPRSRPSRAIGTRDRSFPILQQAIVRYTLDGESANGMMERSMPPDQVDVRERDQRARRGARIDELVDRAPPTPAGRLRRRHLARGARSAAALRAHRGAPHRAR